MRAVNLLPADRRTATRGSAVTPIVREPLLLAAVGTAVLAAVALAAVAFSTSSKVATRHDELRRLDAQLAKVERPSAASSAGGVEARLSTVSAVAAKRASWDSFLESVSRVLPEDVWLTKMTAQPAPSAAASAATATASSSGTTGTGSSVTSSSAPTAFTLTGYTYSQPSVARVLRRLELVPWLRDVTLVTSAKTVSGQYSLYQFTVGANIVSSPEGK